MVVEGRLWGQKDSREEGGLSQEEAAHVVKTKEVSCRLRGESEVSSGKCGSDNLPGFPHHAKTFYLYSQRGKSVEGCKQRWNGDALPDFGE